VAPYQSVRASVVGRCAPLHTPVMAYGVDGPRVTTETLDDLISTSRSQTKAWATRKMQVVRIEAKRSSEEAVASLANLEEVRADLKDHEHMAKAAGDLEHMSVETGGIIQRSMGAMEERFRFIVRAKEELNAMVEARSQESQCEKEKSAMKTLAAENKRAELERFLSMYRNRLGLTLVKAGSHALTVTFTKIDPCHPAREFSFSLRLGEDPLEAPYHAGDCAPPLEKLDDILEALNKEPDRRCALPKFFCRMRRAFKEICTIESGTPDWGRSV